MVQLPPQIYNCIDTIDCIIVPHTCMSSSTNSTNQTQKTLDFRQKFKTQRCRYWYQRGFCPFNQMCAFAHNEDELRDKQRINEHYKTKVCANFKNYGYCKYGDRCQFLHLNEAPIVYNRSDVFVRSPPETLSEKLSDCDQKFQDHRHQKQLNILECFGLDLLSIKNTGRPDKWRQFLISGVDPYEQQAFKVKYFEQEFPDYDFRRKPRLGSL